MIPVPAGSAIAEKSLRLPCRERPATPTRNAPNMLPGNAKRLPVPIRFLIRLVVNAAPTAQKGPRRTPAITFMECWKGKHLAGPAGMETKERATPAPARIPAASAFLKIVLFNVSFLFILYTSIL
jgi:hypothetical protein